MRKGIFVFWVLFLTVFVHKAYATEISVSYAGELPVISVEGDSATPDTEIIMTVFNEEGTLCYIHDTKSTADGSFVFIDFPVDILGANKCSFVIDKGADTVEDWSWILSKGNDGKDAVKELPTIPNGEISFDDVIEFAGVSNEFSVLYSVFTEEVKALFASDIYGVITDGNTIAELKKMIQDKIVVVCIEDFSWSELQNFMLTKINISQYDTANMSMYNNIENKQNVFKKMIDNKDEIIGLDSLISLFNSAVSAVISEETPKQEPQTPSRGGGGGNGGIDVSVKLPEKVEQEQEEQEVPDETEEQEIPPGNTETTIEPFEDLHSVPWAEKAILNLRAKGIVSGVGDNTFVPERPVSRAEYIMMIMNAFDIDSIPAELSEFTDVDNSSWYYNEMSKAVAVNLIYGSDNKLRPNDTMTREEAVAVIDRAFIHKGIVLSPVGDILPEDADEISMYAKEAVAKMYNASVIVGIDGKFEPKSNLTRAQTAVILDKCMNMLG